MSMISTARNGILLGLACFAAASGALAANKKAVLP
jgi:hypothetical protein